MQEIMVFGANAHELTIIIKPGPVPGVLMVYLSGPIIASRILAYWMSLDKLGPQLGIVSNLSQSLITDGGLSRLFKLTVASQSCCSFAWALLCLM